MGKGKARVPRWLTPAGGYEKVSARYSRHKRRVVAWAGTGRHILKRSREPAWLALSAVERDT
jgi:hypothetical protein